MQVPSGFIPSADEAAGTSLVLRVVLYQPRAAQGAEHIGEPDPFLDHLPMGVGRNAELVGLRLAGATFTRNWEGESRRVALDMGRALAGHPCHDIILHGGDEIYIPPSNFAVNVRGQVTIPGIVQHMGGKNSGYYASMVGGYLKNADVRNSHIIRANGLILKATRRFWFDPEVPPNNEARDASASRAPRLPADSQYFLIAAAGMPPTRSTHPAHGADPFPAYEASVHERCRH